VLFRSSNSLQLLKKACAHGQAQILTGGWPDVLNAPSDIIVVTAETNIPPNLRTAQTLEQMIEVVPQVGECDTLEAVTVLADYDRRSKGWLTLAGLWLLSIMFLASLMLGLVAALFLLSDYVAGVLTPTVDPWLGEYSNTLLRLLLGVISALIVFFFFDRAGPKRWLINSTNTLKRRIQLRLLLLRAIRSLIERNSKNVNGNWRSAVCQKCLARFERYWVRFAYWRWISFARCRKCLDDRECYTMVKTIAGWADRGMIESQEQVGNHVKVNMLHRLPPRSLSLPIDLEELVIANVEDDDVEILIFLYREQQPKTDLPKAKRLRCRLARNSTASQMSRRQLKQSFAFEG